MKLIFGLLHQVRLQTIPSITKAWMDGKKKTQIKEPLFSPSNPNKSLSQKCWKLPPPVCLAECYGGFMSASKTMTITSDW